MFGCHPNEKIQKFQFECAKGFQIDGNDEQFLIKSLFI